MAELDWRAVEAEAIGHLQALLRLDTRNPPGDEIQAIRYLQDVLQREGIEPTVLEAAPGRANLVARLSGRGDRADALMVSAHVDVVAVDEAHWLHPPFGGEIHDGYVWGRGAIDMKHMAVYGLMALLLIKRMGLPLERDLVLAAVADEENGMRHGSQWLVEKHPDLIAGRYCLTEAGGFTMHLAGQRLYPVQIAEKGIVWLKMIATGTPGHASMPHRDNAVLKLSRALARLSSTPLPRHPNAAVKGMIAHMEKAVGLPLSLPLHLLEIPKIGEWILEHLADGEQARMLAALLHDTACPTGLAAGKKENVIPSEASAILDCRILPGSSLETLLAEIRTVVKEDVRFEVIQADDPVVHDPGTPLYDLLADVLGERDPGCHVIPTVVAGHTDASNYRRLGYTTYGFAPILLPPDLVFSELFHGHNERIPVDGFRWGLRTFFEVVRRFCCS